MRISITMCLALLLPAVFASGQDFTFALKDDESLTTALKAFHDVMAELLHGPIEEGDFAPLRARCGELAELCGKVMEASLPLKYEKRVDEVSADAANLSASVTALAGLCAEEASDEELKAAFDQMHAAYRDLNTSLLSVEDLATAFHDVLHDLWHEAYPNKDVAAIAKEIPKLKVRAKLLLSTAEKLEDAKIIEVAGKLLEAVITLEEAAAAEDPTAVLEALKLVHDAYQAFE